MRLVGIDFGGLVDPALPGIPAAQRLPYLKRKLWERDRGVCALRGEPIDLDTDAVQMDHILPRSLGGQDHWSNLRMTHRGCNIARGNGLPKRGPYDPPLPVMQSVVTVGVRIPRDVYEPLAKIAAMEDRSLNAQIVRCLRECVQRELAQPSPRQ